MNVLVPNQGRLSNPPLIGCVPFRPLTQSNSESDLSSVDKGIGNHRGLYTKRRFTVGSNQMGHSVACMVC